jgi:hypothetical protein
MKKIKNILIVILFALAFSFPCFAQWPSDFDHTNGAPQQGTNIGTKGETSAYNADSDPTDSTTAYPIDSKLWLLLLAGCTYMFFKLKKIDKKKEEDSVL